MEWAGKYIAHPFFNRLLFSLLLDVLVKTIPQKGDSNHQSNNRRDF